MPPPATWVPMGSPSRIPPPSPDNKKDQVAKDADEDACNGDLDQDQNDADKAASIENLETPTVPKDANDANENAANVVESVPKDVDAAANTKNVIKTWQVNSPSVGQVNGPFMCYDNYYKVLSHYDDDDDDGTFGVTEEDSIDNRKIGSDVDNHGYTA